MDKKILLASIVIILALGAGVGLKYSNVSKKETKPTPSGETASPTISPTPATSETEAGELGPNETKFTDDNFAQEISVSKLVMVDFYLSTCPHCKNMAPIITALSDEFKDQVKIGKLDASANPKKSNEYKVEAVPTLVFLKNGQEVKRSVGEKTIEELRDLINSLK